jgi:hypothetical protein
LKWLVKIAVDSEASIRLGGKVKLSDSVTVGGFMIDWYEKTRKQVLDLKKQLEEIPAEAA